METIDVVKVRHAEFLALVLKCIGELSKIQGIEIPMMLAQ